MPEQAVDRRTRGRADRCVKKIEAMAREWQEWKGEPMVRVRVTISDYLALTECNYLNDGKLSGTSIEVLKHDRLARHSSLQTE